MARKSIIIFAIFLTFPVFTRAEEISLGSFSASDLEKILSETSLSFEGKRLEPSEGNLYDWLKIRPALVALPGYSSEFENIDYIPAANLGEAVLFEVSTQKRFRYRARVANNLAVDEDALKSFLEKERDRTRVAPQNAELAFEGERASVFAASKDGSEIDIEKNLEKITSSFSENPFMGTIALEKKVLVADISSKDVEQYGIKELIGQGVSNFRGSPKNRIHNIRTGASKFNGVILKPGEEFSFVKTLGPVDKSTGYLPELVIKVDKTIPEYGGGMCQVSTTCFRAALNAGLKITARTNHAYPVQYYAPQGTDATVYIPNPDLKFVNDTPAHILIQTRIDGTQLFFDFYGTSDGRVAKLDGPHVTSRGAGGAMKTVLFQEVYDKDGNLIRKDTFKSSYDSPSKYPHPGEETATITEKPSGWSDREWKEYKKAHGL